MLGSFDYALWLISFLAEVYVVVCAVRRGDLFRYFTLNIYVLGLAADTVIRYIVFTTYGVSSTQYRYCYYYTDALLTVVMFGAIISLYSHVFQESSVPSYLRILAFVSLTTTAAYSLLVIQQKRELLATDFVAEFSANLYFVGMVLTYVLWTIVLKRRNPCTRLVLIVTAFGVFFGGHTVTYGLHSLFPSVTAWRYIPPVLGTWLPLSLAFTFTRFSDEDRIPIEGVSKWSSVWLLRWR
jgi:hypothetical protein